MPACGVAQGVARYSPSSSTHAQDPREGPSLAGRTIGSLLRHGLVRLAREEAERSRRGTSQGARDASHDDRSQAGTRRALACAESLFPLWCKGGKRGRGVPRHQAKVSILLQQDQDQQDGRAEVTMEPKTTSSPVVGVLGTGVPRLACLWPAAWLKQWPSAAHLLRLKLKTLARDQASRGGRQESFLRSSLVRLAREEAESSRQGYLVRCP